MKCLESNSKNVMTGLKTGKNGRITENGWASTELITKSMAFNGLLKRFEIWACR